MSLPLEDIIITIDTREQNQKRISAVETWGELHGAIIEHKALKHLDYHILGEYKGHEINIGIEAKALSQWCSDDYSLNKEKLFAACSVYDNVALFIETGNYEFMVAGFGETNISCTVKKDLIITGKLAIFEGACSTLSRYGIHVRQLRSEAHFPYAIENLITYSIHDHDIVKHNPAMYLRSYEHTLKSFMTSVQVKKAVTCYPNLFWLCSASEESYKEIFGAKTGIQIYNFIRNPELMTEAWRNGKFPDGTDKIQLPDSEICDKIKNAIIDYLTEEYPHALTVDELCDHFNIMQGDDDKEAFLIYLKELAWDKKITNIASGEFIITDITKLQSSSIEQLSNAKISHLQAKENKDTSSLGTHDTITNKLICDYNQKPCDQVNAYDCAGNKCKFHPSFKSQCDPAGSLLEKRHNTTPPADDNDKKKVCTHPTHRDLDDCQEEQCIGCGECKYYIIDNDKAGRERQEGQERSEAANKLNSHALLPDRVTLHSNDKTDRSGLTSFSRPPQQGPEPILQAPVLSEYTEVSTRQGIKNPIIKFKDKISGPLLKINICSKCGFQVPDNIAVYWYDQNKPIICSDCDSNYLGVTGIIPVASSMNIEDENFEIQTKDYKLSIRKQLEVFLEKPHTQQECVNKLSNFSKGAISDHIFHMKQEGVIVEFDDKTLVMTK